MKRLTPAERAEILARPSAGLGDSVEKVTATLGIKACDACKRRKSKLNKLVPYGTK
jgi:hypothetical protein